MYQFLLAADSIDKSSIIITTIMVITKDMFNKFLINQYLCITGWSKIIHMYCSGYTKKKHISLTNVMYIKWSGWGDLNPHDVTINGF